MTASWPKQSPLRLAARECFAPRGVTRAGDADVIAAAQKRYRAQDDGLEFPRFRGHLSAVVGRPHEGGSSAKNQTAVSGGVQA